MQQRSRPQNDPASEELASMREQIRYRAESEALLAKAAYYAHVADTLAQVTAQRQSAA